MARECELQAQIEELKRKLDTAESEVDTHKRERDKLHYEQSQMVLPWCKSSMIRLLQVEAATAEGAMVKRLVEQHSELKKVAESSQNTVR